MDIWTERLERRHLAILERWAGRDAGAVTPHDFPADAESLPAWFAARAAEPGRQDCLVRVYDTPVGLAGLRQPERPDTAELYLLLCEVGYNPLRTVTYAALRMLDRAFSEPGVRRLRLRLNTETGEIPDALRRMGFSPSPDGAFYEVDGKTFADRKYLF